MSKHTPGPWIVEYKGKQEWVITAPNGDPILDYQRWDGLASVYGSLDDTSNGIVVGQANASLIAAAPDLLDALSSVVAWIDAPGDSAFSDSQLEACRAAIAKAKGEK